MDDSGKIKVSKEDMLETFANYGEMLKDELEFLGDTYPKEVQDAYKIYIRVIETFADASVNDESGFREVMFARVPKDELRWALKIINKWVSREQRMAEKRKREKDRRERIKGKLEERKLSEKKNQELYKKFETMRLLRAVDALDRIRPIISDQFNPDGFPKPPDLRDKLLELHEKAHKIINMYNCDTDSGMFDLAWEIEEEISEVEDHLNEIRKTIDDLINLTPSDEDEFDDDDDFE